MWLRLTSHVMNFYESFLNDLSVSENLKKMDLTWIIWIEKLLIVLVQTAQSAMRIVVKCSNLLVTTDKFKSLVTYRNLA
jgi:hypothetical protein